MYLYESKLLEARRTSVDGTTGQLDGTRLSRRLLKIFFTVAERRRGTISYSLSSGLVALDETILNSIIGWYLKSCQDLV